MSTSERWTRAIEQASAERDPARSNELITKLHYRLSEAVADALGRQAGPNFHTWAVWGSRKAGATIRQEDLDSAIRNATAAAGVEGALIGAVTGVFVGRYLGWNDTFLAGLTGAALGALTGAWTGKLISIWSRAKAAKLMLRGNQIVVQDIGEQTARFLELLENGASKQGRGAFFAGLRPGPSERCGQDRLAIAFRSYLYALNHADLEAKRIAMIAGNCEIVYHEHIRLEHFIQGAMPFITRASHVRSTSLIALAVKSRSLRMWKDFARHRDSIQHPTSNRPHMMRPGSASREVRRSEIARASIFADGDIGSMNFEFIIYLASSCFVPEL